MASLFELRVQEFKRRVLREALADSNWCVGAAARSLGLSRKAMSDRMHRLGVHLPQGHPMRDQHLNFRGRRGPQPSRLQMSLPFGGEQ